MKDVIHLVLIALYGAPKPATYKKNGEMTKASAKWRFQPVSNVEFQMLLSFFTDWSAIETDVEILTLWIMGMLSLDFASKYRFDKDSDTLISDYDGKFAFEHGHFKDNFEAFIRYPKNDGNNSNQKVVNTKFAAFLFYAKFLYGVKQKKDPRIQKLLLDRFDRFANVLGRHTTNIQLC